MKTVDFNLNSYVLVKLNNEGYKILADNHNSYCDLIDGWERRDAEYYKRNADENGYTKFQGHDFMNTFKEYFTVGTRLPFHGTIKVEITNS